MNRQTKACQSCMASFVVEPEDFDFYSKIKVPPPTFCPECRMQRRFAWRNERTLHRGVCAKTRKNIITGFSPNSKVVVYDRDEWWSDNWDAIDYGRDYDFKKPFFAQWQEFFRQVPHPAVFNTRTTNSDYAQYVGEMKDAYLVSASWGGENLAYAARAHFSRDAIDVFGVARCELCYEDVNATKSTRLFFSQNCEGCTDSTLLYDCRGCTDCVGCVGLRGKTYYIFNTPHSKDNYHKKVKDLNLNSYQGFQEVKDQFELLKEKHIRKYALITNCLGVTGDNVQNTSGCELCFDVSGDTQNCKFIQNGADRLTDSYDGYGVGADAELLYETLDSGVSGARQLFCLTVYGCTDTTYSFNCHGCSNIFGCIGLRNKDNCIFNKQYSKEEFENLRNKIVKQMEDVPYVDRRGRTYKYGEFFPIEISPFGYNETATQDFLPLTKEQAEEKGFNWLDIPTPERQPTIKARGLPDDISNVSEKIIEEIIGCSSCERPYRIIQKEYQFLKRFDLPLPRVCPECRHKARINQRNPLKLWHRQCMCLSSEVLTKEGGYKNTISHFHGDKPCPNEFETSYSPDRDEVVYCEECYNAEVV